MRLLIHILLFIVVIITTFACSSNRVKTNKINFNNIKLISCYDGDTCKFEILDKHFPKYLNPMSVRVLGVDTPEIRGNTINKNLALKAKEFTTNFVKSKGKLQLKNCIKDKYFRFDCDYIKNNKSLAQELLKEKLALPYDGGTKAVWK